MIHRFNHNLPSVLIDRGRGVLKRLLWIDQITKGLCPDVDNGRSGRGRGVLRRQRHGPSWSVADVRANMVRNSEH